MRHFLRGLWVVPLLALGTTAAAQNFPFLSFDAWQEVGPGVRWRSGSSAPPNPRWQIRIVEVDLSNPEVALVPAFRLSTLSTETTSAIGARWGALAAINAGYFGSGASLSHYEKHNVISAFTARPPRSGFGVSAGFPRTLAQTPITGTGASSTGDAAWLQVTNAIGGGPSLLTNGAVDVRAAQENFDAQSGIGPTVRNPRTALAWNSTTQRVWFLTVDGRQTGWSDGMTLEEVARLAQDIGADRAVNYDGGGSTACVVQGTVRNRPSDGTERGVVTAWLVLPGYTVDNLDPGFSTTGSWTASANAGYFGENSLVNGVGTGTEEARWTVSLATSGTYRVEARWVAAGNRPSAAAYVVEHRLGSTASPQNQTTNNGTWVLLGEFSFDAGMARVRLSDAAPSGSFVSADAIRWIRTGDLPPTGPTGWVTE